MIILSGISSGMVMQRNIQDDLCDIHVQLSCIGEPRISLGELIAERDNWYHLRGIPCGGPYTLTISDDRNEVVLSDIYVGDVWMLAGQSNMEGAGLMTEWEDEYEKNPDAGVRAFYLDDHWDVAKAQLHQQWKNTDKAIADYFVAIWTQNPVYDWSPEKPQRNGVGPGLFLGLELKQYMGVPQGLIACAYGGANLKEWHPLNNDPGAYYPTFVRRLRACGGNIRGIFWYQGESETSEEGVKMYRERMLELISAMRRDTHKTDLPIVIFQLSNNVLPGYDTTEGGSRWSKIREAQRLLVEDIENMDMAATMDLSRVDRVHLNTASSHVAGHRGARAMYALCGGNVLAAPKLESIKIEPDVWEPLTGNLLIQYKNLEGGLTAIGENYGFSVALDQDQAYTKPHRNILGIILEGNRVRVRTTLTCDELQEAFLWYGAGNCECTIRDNDQMSIPAMGPLRVRDYT